MALGKCFGILLDLLDADITCLYSEESLQIPRTSVITSWCSHITHKYNTFTKGTDTIPWAQRGGPHFPGENTHLERI